ncbi:MAG TPA: NlpC/P60 family protein [Jatrophihabitans sp.]|jgi:cell wall-associated NlpC family hydrolase
MAIRLVRRPNSRARSSRRLKIAGAAAVLISAAVTLPTVASATPAGPTRITPKIHSVQQQLRDLSVRNDQIVEKYNQADEAYTKTKTKAARADAVYHRAQRRLDQAQAQLAQTAVAQYEGGAFSTTGALLSSDSGSSYLDQLQTLSMLSAHNSQVVTSFAAVQEQAKQAKVTAENLFTQARQTRAALQRQHTKTQQQITKFKKVLASLNAQQRALWAARQGAEISAGAASQMTNQVVHASSAAAQAAVHFALAQVGKPYVFGAAGPGAYDCSGLTMASWAQGGVSLPHSAQDQYNYGHHVSYDQLRPGDLMFFYQPIGHVTIYIGNGMMVSAPEPGENVKVVAADVFGSDFVGATRLVG